MDLITLALAKKYTDIKFPGDITGTDYNGYYNKPKINGVELKGNKTSMDFGLSKVSASSEDEPDFLSKKISTKAKSGLTSEIIDGKLELGLVLDDSTTNFIESYPLSLSNNVELNISNSANWTLAGVSFFPLSNFLIKDGSMFEMYITRINSVALKGSFLCVYEAVYDEATNTNKYNLIAKSKKFSVSNSEGGSVDSDVVVREIVTNDNTLINIPFDLQDGEKILISSKKKYFLCVYARKSSNDNTQCIGIRSTQEYGNRFPAPAILCYTDIDENQLSTPPVNLDNFNVRTSAMIMYIALINKS